MTGKGKLRPTGRSNWRFRLFRNVFPSEMAPRSKQESNPHTDSRATGGRRYRAHQAHFEAPTPNATMRSGFTKDSLPIGTEIDVDGQLANNGRQRDRPRCHVSGRRKVVSGIVRCRCFGPPKMIVGRVLPPAGRTRRAWRGFRQRPRASENAPPQHPIAGRAQPTRYWRNPPICTSKPSGSRMCRLVLVSP